MSGITKRLALLIAMIFAAGIFYSAPAAAQATRTWVSGVGDDANPCSRTAPCKTFLGAIPKTAASGEINCLDPAGYGTVTITKSITIDCTGTFGSLLASSTTGIIVNGPNAIVIIRGVSINGAPVTAPGINGIRVLQAASVLIERVNIFGFGGSAPNGYALIINNNSANTQVTILNSSFQNNRGGGVLVEPVGAFNANLAVVNSSIDQGGSVGIVFSTLQGATALTGNLTNSTITGGITPGSGGIVVRASAGSAKLFVKNSTISDAAQTGIFANGAGAVVRVSGSTITNNGTGVGAVNGGQIISTGNNQLFGNTTDGAFSSTIPQN